MLRIATAPAAVAGRTRTRTSNSGSLRRSSRWTKRAPAASPTAPTPITSGLPQPTSVPSISAKTMPPSAAIESATPSRSTGGVPGRVDSGSTLRPAGTTIAATGTLTRKTASHPTSCTSTPPSSGPITRPAPATAAHTPSACGRSAGGNITAISDSAGGRTQAAAAPISARAPISAIGDCASAQSTEAMPKPAMPARKTRLRPNRSASPLPRRSSPASATRNASITHWSSPTPAFRSSEMSGSATLTIVMSTALMNIAPQTTNRPCRRRSCGTARSTGR